MRIPFEDLRIVLGQAALDNEARDDDQAARHWQALHAVERWVSNATNAEAAFVRSLRGFAEQQQKFLREQE